MVDGFKITQNQLSALCGAIGATQNTLLSKSVLAKRLRSSNIPIWDSGIKAPPGHYVKGPNKADWLYNCLASEINRSGHSCECVARFIEVVFDPVSYTAEGDRSEYQRILNDTNKVLLTMGWEIGSNGALQKVVPAETLSEVDRRLDSLKAELKRRGIHDLVTVYSRLDIENRDYGSAVLESVKGVMSRVREMTGLADDGRKLFEQAFSWNGDPYLRINKGETRSEKDEQRGLQEFFCGLLGLVRNPLSHTLKLDWNIDERQSVEVLTLASAAHRYLDRCFVVPGKQSNARGVFDDER